MTRHPSLNIPVDQCIKFYSDKFKKEKAQINSLKWAKRYSNRRNDSNSKKTK